MKEANLNNSAALRPVHDSIGLLLNLAAMANRDEGGVLGEPPLDSIPGLRGGRCKNMLSGPDKP